MVNTSKQLQIFKCSICGNIIEVQHVGGGELVCCNQPMNLLGENTADAATEKHVPVVEKTAEGIVVSVGEVEHPMSEEHYIQWIQLIADWKSYRTFLKPGDKPKATFTVNANEITAREYCNLHGLWKA